MTYWEIFYGKCKAKPLGSSECCAYCRICLGSNWVPLGVKSFEEFRTYFLEKTK